MGRSPSPPRRRRDREKKHRRHRDRDRSRDHERDRERERRVRERSRDRELSRERARRRSRTKSRSPNRRASPKYREAFGGSSGASGSRRPERPVVAESDLVGKSPEEQEMMKMMGFSGFETTKNMKVEGNDVGEVHVILKRKYRQYMNRKGGFNRPLDFVA